MMCFKKLKKLKNLINFEPEDFEVLDCRKGETSVSQGIAEDLIPELIRDADKLMAFLVQATTGGKMVYSVDIWIDVDSDGEGEIDCEPIICKYCGNELDIKVAGFTVMRWCCIKAEKLQEDSS